MLIWLLRMALLAVLLSACRSQPQETIYTGGVLLRETFDRTFEWSSGARDNVSVGAADGAYRIRSDVSAYVRGYHSVIFDDVVIDVDVIQLSQPERNAYGVMCRAAPQEDSANGYYFLISGDGSFSIRKGQFADLVPLIHWRRSGAVHRGTAINRLRVVCVGDYLALYINDQFVADVRDSTYQRGVIGFAAATREGMLIEAAFDNLIVWEGRLQE